MLASDTRGALRIELLRQSTHRSGGLQKRQVCSQPVEILWPLLGHESKAVRVEDKATAQAQDPLRGRRLASPWQFHLVEDVWHGQLAPLLVDEAQPFSVRRGRRSMTRLTSSVGSRCMMWRDVVALMVLVWVRTDYGVVSISSCALASTQSTRWGTDRRRSAGGGSAVSALPMRSLYVFRLASTSGRKAAARDPSSSRPHRRGDHAHVMY